MDLEHLVCIGLARAALQESRERQSFPCHGSSTVRSIAADGARRGRAANSVRLRNDIDDIIETIVSNVSMGTLDIERWECARKRRAREQHQFPDQTPLSSAELVRNIIGKAVKPKKKIADFLEDLGVLIEDLLPPPSFKPVVFNVFGCPHSTDVDLVAVAPNIETVEKIQSGEVSVDLSSIKSTLKAIGYDPFRTLDVRIVSIHERREVELCAGPPGNKQVQNMVFHTFHLHTQAHHCLFTHGLEIDLLDQLRTVAKLVLDSRAILTGMVYCINDSSTAAKEQRAALMGCGSGGKGDAWRRLDSAVEVMRCIEFSEGTFAQEGRWAQLMKQLCMKIVQIALLMHGMEAYTKDELLTKSVKLFRNDDGLRYLLFQGKQGDACQVSAAMQELWATFQQALVSRRTAIDWTATMLPNCVINPTDLPDEVFWAILQSPLSVPPELRKWFHEVHVVPGKTVSLPSFILRSSPWEMIPVWLQSRIEFADQRSAEWLRLYKFYTCGRHSNVPMCSDPEAFIDTYYHLVRGCVMEMVMMYSLDYKTLLRTHNVRPASVGFIVEDKGREGAVGAAPDLLLIFKNPAHGEDHVIPVEIKTMNEPFAENANYRREVKLATAQLRTACQLIGRGDCGLLLMAWWERGHWELRHSFINVNDGSSVVPPYVQ